MRHHRRQHLPPGKAAGHVPVAGEHRQIFDSLPLHRRRFDLAEAVAADQALRSPAPVSVDRTKFFDALEQEPFRQVCTRFLSLMQPRARAARPLKELLHIPFKKRKDK